MRNESWSSHTILQSIDFFFSFFRKISKMVILLLSIWVLKYSLLKNITLVFDLIQLKYHLVLHQLHACYKRSQWITDVRSILLLSNGRLSLEQSYTETFSIQTSENFAWFFHWH